MKTIAFLSLLGFFICLTLVQDLVATLGCYGKLGPDEVCEEHADCCSEKCASFKCECSKLMQSSNKDADCCRETEDLAKVCIQQPDTPEGAKYCDLASKQPSQPAEPD